MINVMDCTLRDGSYVNKFQFTAADTASICRRLEEAGIRYVEVGHGLGLGAYRKGGEYEAAATDAACLEAAAGALTSARFGMFCIPGIASLDDVDVAHAHGMHFIRIGADVTNIESTQPFIERAKKHGMLVCANYMKSYVVPADVFAQKARQSESYGADVVYVVDSAGGMLPAQVHMYVRAVLDATQLAVGYHGHNNLGLAISNSLLAMEHGATFIDACLQGIGRSAGNASTEQLAMLLQRMNVEVGLDLFQLLDAGFELIQPLLVQVGLNPIDLVAGYAQFHSSYIPVIRRYSNMYCVDPRELIVKLCECDRVEAPPAIVEEIASRLTPKDRGVFFARYHLERYFVNEQQALPTSAKVP